MKTTLMTAIISFFCCLFATVSQGETLRCATTTSTDNSGLLAYLMPMLEKDTGLQMHFIAVGTGAALQLGKRGDVDMVFVHAKEAELKLVEEGAFINRQDVMYNDFVLVGPADDPAGAKATSSVTEAFAAIAQAKAIFVSRGDDSGTHRKELKIWAATGIKPTPAQDNWYLEVGQGMAKSIRIADQKKGYILTDRGTLLAMEDANTLSLAIVFQHDDSLNNQYGVMAVNPERHDHINTTGANKFIDWITSQKGQEKINAFRNSKGDQLFTANAK